MNLRWILAAAISILSLLLSACGGGGGFQGNDFSSKGPASSEPAYYGKPTTVTNGLRVQMSAKFLYRQLDFTPGSSTNGLSSVVNTLDAVPIPFAEFHVYDSSGNRVQQGETTTAGIADFEIPKTAGTYTLKVFSRAYNDYLKISVLEDIYQNAPYSISQNFTITQSDITLGTTKDLTTSPVYAQANENISSKIEGGAFNIYYDILLANEYIRRNIFKNNGGTPSTNTNVWWVADKVTVYWKAGFNPYTYFNSSTPLSFYSPGERKLYILGGNNGDVKSADTDHFDDSVILHEYGHFLEDAYGHSESPGGSHNGNFIIDARLAWSEGWANYLQSAVLTGADAYDDNKVSPDESRIPTTKRYHYYVDTYGYKGGGTAGVGISFNLAGVGTDQGEPDNVFGALSGTGIFREVSVARTLYKSTRRTTASYDTGKFGGGVAFAEVWETFAGENTAGNSRSNPIPYSLRNSAKYPIPNIGLFNWLLSQNVTPDTKWDDILTEEKQNKSTQDYAYFLKAATCAGVSISAAAMEEKMGVKDPVYHSNQQKNNDFYLYYHDGSSTTLGITYTTSGNAPDLDLILYYGSYVYFEDSYWYGGYSSPYVAKSSRTIGTSESVSLAGLPAGYYMLNVKVNAYGKTNSDMSGTSTYKIYKNGTTQLCGTEQP
ncbi:hypothetical protein [Bdellovibrio sp. HCB-162]|uniref:hypothetical protein n=1 Tax=Bdellovibrio sp. HCB-162 TaxID=3394234 RepID=UPI0039BD5E20